MFTFKRKKKEVDTATEPLLLNYYNDGSLFIPKKIENVLISSIKQSKINEIKLLDYSINNISTKLVIMKKMLSDNENNLENSRKQFVEQIKREVNPDLLCQICFDSRINVIITPCGHTFCNNCLGNTTICFNCRANIEHTFKLYI
jgi:hypothetical protein|tara:strand:+ start:54 stop:488 length:435 start_codon:yes stop_codon:yes gene_type:complete